MYRKHIAAFTVALVFPLVLMGCGESENRSTQIEKDVIEAQGRAEGVRAHVNLKVLETAIQQYYVEWGRFPKSLNDLPILQNQGIDPDLYEYDPATGKVRLR
ncbi:MAG: type II secretion system protein GspG [Anaerolineales bacterium]